MSKHSTAPLVLTLDVGSSGVRVRLYDQSGTAVSGVKAKQDHTITTTPDGGAVLDADELTSACEAVLDTAVKQLDHVHGEVIALAGDTLVPNILGLDAGNTPITPVYTWGDTRAHTDALALRQELDPTDYHERTGCILHASYIPAKLRWLRRTDPELYGRVKRWVSVGEYLFLRWFGEARCSLSVASWSGLLNRHTLEWDQATLAALELTPDQLGTLADTGDGCTAWLPAYRKRWSALSDATCLPIVGDGVGSNIGSGCTTPDRVALVVATSGAMRVMLDGTPAQIPPGLWSYRVDRKRCLLGGAVSNGTNVFDWLDQTLRLPPSKALEQALGELPPAGHGLTVLPFLAGERSPGWADDATAAFVGLRLATKPIQILQAALEAVAFRFALIHQGLKAQLPPAHTLVASGKGFVQSPTWVQITADVLGQPVVASDQKSATARGIALLAFDLLGTAPLQGVPFTAAQTFQPRADRHAVYVKALAQHTALYNELLGGAGSIRD